MPPPGKRMRQATRRDFAGTLDGWLLASPSKRVRRVGGEGAQKFEWETGDPRGLLVCKTSNWPHGEPSAEQDRSETHNDKMTSRVRVAAFDLDSTLIVPSSGARFPRSATDWRLMNSRVRPAIAAKHAQGFRIVIFTNQGGFSIGKISLAFLQERLQGISESLKVPLAIYVATRTNHYRKPGVGMWDRLVADLAPSSVHLEESFYVGDAAGRIRGKRKDFSDSDRKFALNVGIKFYTPEQFFNDSKESLDQFPLTGFDPRTIAATPDHPLMYRPADIEPVLKRIVTPLTLADKLINGGTSAQCMVILVGYPGAGKSTLTTRYLEPLGYVRINNDTLRTKARCLKATKDALTRGKSVVIDNTNPSPGSRRPYIDAAQAYKVSMPIYCVVMEASRQIAEHLNVFRARITKNDALHVPKVAYHTFARLFKAPTPSEKFSGIGKARFVMQFLTEDEHKVFLQLS